MDDLKPVCVVLPAAGSGDRHGSDVPKQFSLLHNKPLILHTLHTFHRISWIDHIIVPVHPKFEALVSELVSKYELTKVKVVHGMGTRHRSIYAGIKAISTVCESPNIVLVHDAVRVFVDEETMKQVAENAHQHGAAGVTCPLVSTIICPDSNDQLEESLDRTKYRASEMPQGFKYDIIRSAYDKATDYDFDYGTECLLLAKKHTGTRAKLIEGPASLWKVTYKKDSYAAEGMIKEQLYTVNLCAGAPNQQCDTKLVDRLQTLCQQRNIQLTTDDSITDCNTRLYYYPDSDTGSVVWNTNNIRSMVTDSPELVNPCVIHVCSDKNHSPNRYLEFLRVVQKLAKQCKPKDILVYGVYNQCGSTSDSYDKLAELVMSVLWNREATQNGQICSNCVDHPSSMAALLLNIEEALKKLDIVTKNRISS